MTEMLAQLGRRVVDAVAEFGDFWRFTGRAHRLVGQTLFRARGWGRMSRQMFKVGTRSIPVVMITGLFVGMVLATQTVHQFKNLGMEGALGSIVNLSVVRELGPVLAGILLAGRVGGAISAELGTMKVTEQLDALRAMGADPVGHLVTPRFLACMILGPFLVIYADVMGIFGGYYISVFVYDVNPGVYWSHSAAMVGGFDIALGLIKSVLFGWSMALICCYKAFRCQPGAAGVGRACTESFVVSCMVILALDFFANVFLGAIHVALYGHRVVLM
jgi:phospholipid/cholesterol/gamma-HCH transport system permease protein